VLSSGSKALASSIEAQMSAVTLVDPSMSLNCKEVINMEAIELAPNYYDDPDATPPNLLGHYAGLVIRIIAFAIDALIVALALALIPWLVQILLESIGIGSLTTRWMVGVGRLLASGIFAILFTYSYYAFSGTSWHDDWKRGLGIRIIRTNGNGWPSDHCA
jgi:hypothetical protein